MKSPVLYTLGATAGTQRQQHVGGIRTRESRGQRLENLSGEDTDHECLVRLYFIHEPRTQFHRGQASVFDSRTANRIVLHFVLKEKNPNKPKRQNRDRVEGDAS